MYVARSSPSLRHLSPSGQCAALVLSASPGLGLWQQGDADYHRGRKSGLLRRTILEVLSFDPQTCEVLVVSGWEGKTDWYRNIQQEPALEVRVGRVHYRPVQEFLSPQETAQLILTLFRLHPREVRFVGPLLGIDPDAEEADLQARLEAFFRGVRFQPAA